MPDLHDCRPANAKFFNQVAVLSLLGLVALCVAWELWLAPLRPGGSWLVLKSVPLLLPLFGLLHGKRYTHQWSSLLIQLYLLEGLTRATSDTGRMQQLAIAEVILALIFFAATLAYARMTAPSRLQPPIKAAD